MNKTTAALILLLGTASLTIAEQPLVEFRLARQLNNPPVDTNGWELLVANTRTVWVQRVSFLTDADIRSAQFSWSVPPSAKALADLKAISPGLMMNTNSRPLVEFNLTDHGKEVLAQFTQEHVDEFVAILNHGNLISAPLIREPIRGGCLVMEGESETLSKSLVTSINQGKGLSGGVDEKK